MAIVMAEDKANTILSVINSSNVDMYQYLPI